MQQYVDLVKKVINEGVTKPSRPGIDTKSIFGHTVEFNLQGRRMPMVTLKETWWHGICTELCWFLRGKMTRQWLHNHKVHIWDQWDVPYSLDRDVVMLQRKERYYVPYEGDVSIEGIEVTDDVDRKLYEYWVWLMRECYQDNIHSGYSVVEKWHDSATFVQEAKGLPHWNYKLKDWDRFVLSCRYHGSKLYSYETCVWLDKEEDEYYTEGSQAISVDLDSDDQPDLFFLQGSDGRVPQAALPRLLQHHVPKVRGQSFYGWNFTQVGADEGDIYRLDTIKDGSLGPVYGYQWRHWPKYDGGEVDQIAQVLAGLKNDPHGRRHIISAWNVAQIEDMALPPCHLLVQFWVGGEKLNQLNCHVYQRSCDLFLGVPFNWASYALLTHIIADFTGLKGARLVWTGGDVHLYSNHIPQVVEMLKRTPRQPTARLRVGKRYAAKDIGQLHPQDFYLDHYRHHGKLGGEVAV